MSPQTKAAAPLAARTRAVDQTRRRLATGAAVGAAGLFLYFAVWGHNGILSYSGKRNEDRVLAAEIQKLNAENARLQTHVDHLQNDPAAVEHEAREQLHYARPGEVIYTLDPHTPARTSPAHTH